MGHTRELHAVVLKTYDIGDADRFYILLSKERGKIAARARGVRKLQSKMGGSLLAPNRILVSVHEGSSGNLITGSTLESERAMHPPLSVFLRAQQAMEILITVLEDDHPVPEIYDLLVEFLEDNHPSLLCFTIQLLNHFGLLPSDTDHDLFEHVSEEEKQFVESSLQKTSTTEPKRTKHLQALCDHILDHHLSKSLKAGVVARNMSL